MEINGYEIGPGANLINAVLVGAWLEGVDLAGADLTDADLSGAFLSRANLTEARLIRASLIKARLSDAILNSADLTEADLSGADLSNVDAISATFEGARLDKSTKLDNAKVDSDELKRAIFDTTEPKRETEQAIPEIYAVTGTPRADLGSETNRNRNRYEVSLSNSQLLQRDLNYGVARGWDLVSVIPEVNGYVAGGNGDVDGETSTNLIVIWDTNGLSSDGLKTG